MDKLNKELLITLLSVFIFIIVSLNLTYKITNNIFGSLVGSDDQTDYGTGFDFSNRGFWIHIIVFAILVFLPMHFGGIKE